jgi:DNA-3-methyladenine glycosylase I
MVGWVRDDIESGGGSSEAPGGAEVVRCAWPGLETDPLYRRYHDEEWGVPVHGTVPLFERLCLEAFQSGLSWLTILRKRPAFRDAFAGFRPAVLAGWGAADVDRLLGDAGIVRNRQKIVAVLANARAVLAIDATVGGTAGSRGDRSQDDGAGGPGAGDSGLDRLLWSFAPPRRVAPPRPGDIASSTPESSAMARELKRRGVTFVGPTTAYALMQATGMVDDHVAGCFRALGRPPADRG